jgi:phosphoribosyl 1,2-cyclic phosphodiesterase/ActR/RegA family two-component response regulator
MTPRRRLFLVDDDAFGVAMMEALLAKAGFDVVGTATDPAGAMARLVDLRPDAVLVDVMMPGMDGLAFCRAVRAEPALSRAKVVVVSAKAYDADRRQAAAAGAHGFLQKPVGADFAARLSALLDGGAELRYWGVRGTLPVPGPRTLRYGGNTCCVTLSFADGRLFVFDAGSGIKELAGHLLRRRERVSAHLFVSHPHWDHINALPYFAPLYIPGNAFEILGPSQGAVGMRQIVSDQMEPPYFPVTVREFGSHVTYRDLGEGSTEVAGVPVDAMLLAHPGNCLGYRVRLGGATVCYVTDNELYPPSRPEHDPRYLDHLAQFVGGADLLITDCTYTDEAYPAKAGWGHSATGQVAELAHRAGVKELHLFHHDPDQSDDDIDRKLEQAAGHLARLGSSTSVRAPAEGDAVAFAG